MIAFYHLNPNEIQSINAHLDAFVTQHQETLLELYFNSQQVATTAKKTSSILSLFSTTSLPDRLARQINNLQFGQSKLIVVIGYELDDQTLSNTPDHWKNRHPNRESLKFLAYQLLLSSAAGTPYAMPSVQENRLVHELIPIESDQYEQYGTGSRSFLKLHTEDAFDEDAPHILSLACLRNPDLVETIFSIPDLDKLSNQTKDSLAKRAFLIKPDPSHFINSERMVSQQEAQAQIANYEKKVPVFKNGVLSNHIRFDDAFTFIETTDPLFNDYQTLKQEVARAEQAIALCPGDIAIFDNERVVHGRAKFQAQYDGHDRWMRRIYIRREWSI